jgi:thioesterase domain-containing protein
MGEGEAHRFVGEKYVNDYSVPMRRELEEVARLAEDQGGSPVRGNGNALGNVQKVMNNNGRLAANYAPSPFHGDLLLFAAELDRPPERTEELIASWDPYVQGQVESHRISCAHFGVLQPGPLAEIGGIVSGKLQENARSQPEGVAP